ncbi:hypothetical protein RP29_00330 [Acidovorax temperans]|uniref:TnsA endonuclease-like protein n=1 Tax=Acidovorax temperans TaxID=80878 RepID=A0A0D7KDU5_9BURK|nr:hypothetical protein [Acidovorax temperans]KJA12350.1 hypothetical protein RP29_00330 [Acidovorax temperans]
MQYEVQAGLHMTTYRGESRNIDNSRLLGLRTGRVYVTPLRQLVSWEGYGERALLILNERRRGLRAVVAQPGPKRYVRVGGKLVRYTADYELTFHDPLGGPHSDGPVIQEVWEAKSERALSEERWQEKQAAIEAQVSAEGKRFRVLNSTTACYSMELRTAEVLRLYRTVPVALEVEQWLTEAVSQELTTIGELAEAAEHEGLGRQHIYAALYVGILNVDESKRLNDTSLVTKGLGRIWPDTFSSQR